MRSPFIPEPGRMSAEDYEKISRLLLPLEGFEHRIGAAFANPAHPHSRAAQEITDRLRKLAYDIASIKIYTALDHMRTWRVLLTEANFVPSLAIASLTRTALECSVQALWILGTPDPDLRRERGVRAQLEDYRQRRAAEADGKMAPPDPPAKSAAERHKELRDEVLREGLTRFTPKGNALIIDSFPTSKALFDECLPQENLYLAYRFMSATAHGMQWQVYTADMQQVTPFDSNGSALARIGSNDNNLYEYSRIAMKMLSLALDVYEALRQR